MMPFDLTSVGRIAGDLQQPVSQIRDIADRLGITPSRINGVPHYSAEDLELIAARIRCTATDASRPGVPDMR